MLNCLEDPHPHMARTQRLYAPKAPDVNPSEQRLHPRFSLPLTLGVRASFPGGFEADLVDLSASGFSVLLPAGGAPPPEKAVATFIAGFLRGSSEVELIHRTPSQAGYCFPSLDAVGLAFVGELVAGLRRGRSFKVRNVGTRRLDLVNDRGESLVLGFGPNGVLSDGSLLCQFEDRKVGLTYRHGSVGFLDYAHGGSRAGQYTAEERRVIGVGSLLLSGLPEGEARQAVQPWIGALVKISTATVR
jgi:hypothetical protein